MSGKHAAPAKSTMYRDLATMLGAIGVVAVLVYFGLSALAGPPPDSDTSTTSSATTDTPTPSTTTGSSVATSTTTTTTTTTPATTVTTPAVRPPGEVRVIVLNSIGVTGLAGQVSARLADLGYNTLTPDNYSPALEQTRVWYLPGFEAEAYVLAAEFPDALIEQNPDLAVDADIVVVLGETYEA
ncbi:MAG TPA: LytR C-terminal domain-containing protein [Acidimicrobiia bacterium]|nr:LytR C-terminal domain-containing protein [Acidimicrobiia bacterium]